MAAAADDDESRPDFYRVLVERCNELEANHAGLNQEMTDLAQERGSRGTTSLTGGKLTKSDTGLLPRYFKAGRGRRSPYEQVLQSIGHAVHVTSAETGEITYWNRSAEILYGWRDNEVIGRRDLDFLIDSENAPTINQIMKGLHSGQSWSGQFPLKRRSGEIFIAIVTKSPLYEDDELVGFITVSSDAAVFNDDAHTNPRTSQDYGNEEFRVPELNPRRPQWHQLPPINSLPQIASSVSSLASKVLSKKHGDDIHNKGSASTERAEAVSDSEDAPLKNPKAAVAKIFSKLNIRRNNQTSKENDGNSFQNGSFASAASNQVTEQPSSPRVSQLVPPNSCCNDARSLSLGGTGQYPTVYRQRISSYHGEATCSCSSSLSKECNKFSKDPGMEITLPTLTVEPKELEHELGNRTIAKPEGDNEQLPVVKKHPSSGGSIDNVHESSSSKGDHESSLVDIGIQWDELQLGEEVGQGSYAVVYRGIWNGSDVAIKLFWNEYNEGTLIGYKKEIDIMRRLRHPNVLLFMGACYSHERLAIVTEFLPRGSLFKTLHRSNQVLDMKRRLKMALDVARGMNYLHRRNPPIVHRDLKSSNLLVDKNWTVKVGDFGLSRLKHSTLLSAKSGLGTPQWMAPEILRNEPSSEKSDVFSFGVILWELMTVSIPWNSLNPVQVVGVVGFMDSRLDIPESLDPHIASTITDCWQSKPEGRPSFQDIIHRLTGLLRNVQ